MTIPCKMTPDRFELGKQAALSGEIDLARELLGPIAELTPHHPAAFFLCQVESRKGSLENCIPYCEVFLGKHPQHAGMRTISAMLNIDKGELVKAEKDLEVALRTNEKHHRALKIKTQLAKLKKREAARKTLEVIDQSKPGAKRGILSRINAARILKETQPEEKWDNDIQQAKIAFFHNRGDVRHALKNYEPGLIEIAVKLGYCTWPRKIQQLVQNRRVLDVGCGFTGYSIGFLCAGAATYTGVDPAMALDTKRMRDKRLRKWVEVNWSGQDVEAAIPDIALFQGTTRDLVGSGTFDTVCLHNVTEHLLDLDGVFSDITKLMAKSAKLVFLHHNFYGWSGHHRPPHNPSVLDPRNPEHVKFCDWNHLSIMNNLPDNHYINTGLNRIRIHDLRQITEKYFHIESWNLLKSPRTVLDRLSPDIEERARVAIPGITRYELEANAVHCIASAKP